VAGQRLVELACDPVEDGQPGPRDGWEVVVLVVQADVVGEDVEGSIVRVCLGRREGIKRVRLLIFGVRHVFFAVARLSRLPLLKRLGTALLNVREEVVLRDEVARARMQRSCQERAQEQIIQRLQGAAAELYKRIIEGELHDQVQDVDIRKGRAVNEHGPEGVEEDLEGAEEGLAQQGVEEEGFQSCWEIGIQTRDTERLVVRQMVGLFKRQLVNGRYGQRGGFRDLFGERNGQTHTLNAALYGSPIGRLANMANSLFASAERKARLWDIS